MKLITKRYKNVIPRLNKLLLILIKIKEIITL